MARGVVYLSNGRLSYKAEGDGPSLPLDSAFATAIRQRAFELQRRHAWKTQGRGAQFMSGGAALWGADRYDPQHMRIDITAVCRGPEGSDLFYALQSPDISGVLRARGAGTQETRILHTSDFHVGALAAHPETGRLAMTIRHRGGSTIAVMEADGRDFSEVTQGESMDESPSWIPNAPARIVFQSAGIAQNAQGAAVGIGPYAIQMLDLETGKMTPILEDPKTDFLSPKVGPGGALYFIRRPYRLAQTKFNLFRAIEAILLFPYRLLYAIFQWLNFFTMLYTGKPLAKSGPGSERAKDRPANMVLWGNLIEARRSMMDNDDDSTGLVPQSWELCRQAKGTEPEVLAKGVLSFDLEEEGTIVFSNGTTVSRRSPDGKITSVLRDAMIRQVISASYLCEVAAPEVSGLAALDVR